MKKLVVILLMGAFAMFSSGYYMVYRCNIKSLKRQMRTAIRSGTYNTQHEVELQFDLTNASLLKEVEVKDEGKEIRYKEMMYDVLTIKIKNNKLIIHCLADKEETDAIAGFTKWLESGVAGKKPLKLIKYSFPVFTVDELSIFKQEPFYKVVPWYHNYTAHFLPLHYLNIPSPPPWQS